MTLRALIFDVDGTLADTEEAHRHAFNLAFQQAGLAWHWSQRTYADLLRTTGGKERMAVYIRSLPLPPAEQRRLMNRINLIHDMKTLNYTRMVLAGEVPLRDGVARLLDEAAGARISLAIASTTTYANIEALLRATLGPGAMKRFAVIGAGDQVPRKKPAPDIYEHVLCRLDASPEDCVAIEDSANGLRAAKAAGLYTIVTPSYWTLSEDFSSADLLLPTLGSEEHPLPSLAGSQVGSRLLGIRDIERHIRPRLN